MKDIKLEDFTELELFELRSKINKELETYQDRSKIMVYKVDQEFGEHAYFINKENAIELIQELINYDELFNNKTEITTRFLTESEAKAWCRDYEK